MPPVPEFEIALVLNRVNWIADNLKKVVGGFAALPDGPIKVSEKGDVWKLESTQPVPPGMPFKTNPIVVHHKQKDWLILSSGAAFADSILSTSGKWAASPSFKSAWEGLPEKGNSALYISPRIQVSFVEAIEAEMKKSSKSPEGEALFKAVLKSLGSKFKEPIVSVSTNLPSGILSVTQTSLAFPHKESGIASGIMGPMVISTITGWGLAAPQALKELQKREKDQDKGASE